MDTLIAVGSTNRVKVAAVRNGLMGEAVTIISYPAASRVRDQPLSDEETQQGAINRARECLEKTQATLAIGLEGGLQFLTGKLYLCHWGALVDRDQIVYLSNSPILRLPDEYKNDLLAGVSLDQLMLKDTGIENLGTKEGAIGYFTENRLTREQVLSQTVKILYGQYCCFNKQVK